MYLNRMMKFFFILCLLIQLLFAGIFSNKHKKPDNSIPFFKYKIYSYPVISRDSINIKIKMSVPFNELQFIKYNNQFRAIFESTVIVLNKNEKQCYSKMWTDTITVDQFKETNILKSFKNKELSFGLVPDKYTIKYGIRDFDSKKKQYFTKAYNFSDYYKKSIVISEMKLEEQLGKVEKVRDEKEVFADTTDNQEKLYKLDYQVLSEGGMAKITYKIEDLKEKIIFEKSFEKLLDHGLINLDFMFDAKNLHYREYILKIKLQLGKEMVEREKKFQIRWSGMNYYIRNIDEAIDQLIYITDTKTLKKIRSSNNEKQKDLFLEFWRSKDPTPGTIKNELMNEYYSRIRYANTYFQGHRKGWRSDMGMVFVLFGAPDNIERHPFEVNSRPYEVWYYNTNGKVYYFIDDSGFGDYRLINSNQMYY